MTAYTVPDTPTDPEAAALELIVRTPEVCMDAPAGVCEILQEFCGVLQLEGCFTGLSWADAKQIAAAVAFDAVTRDDAPDFIRNRARNVLAGTDNMPWQDRERAARALNIAATVLGL